MEKREKVQASIEALHQHRMKESTASRNAGARAKRVKKIEKKLEKMYNELSVVNRNIRKVDQGDNYKPPEGESETDIMTGGCCSVNSTARHRFETTGHAFVMFQFMKDAELCLSQLNRRPKHIYGMGFSRAGNNLKMVMRNYQQKASSWVKKIEVGKPTQPRDVLWKNLEYNSGAIRLRSILLWSAVLPVLFLGFAITCTLSKLKLELVRQCNNEELDNAHALFPFIENFISNYIYSGTAPSWFCHNGYAYIFTVLASATIALINVILANFIIKLTTRLERSHRKSKILGKVVFRIALAQYLNSCVSQLITFNNYSNWENQGDLVDSAVTFVYITAFQPVISLILKKSIYPIMQSFGRKKIVTTRKLNETFLPPPFDLERRYAHLVCAFMNAQFFVALVPSVMGIAVFGMSIAYWCDKYMLLRLCNTKALIHLSENGAMNAISLCGFFTVITSVAGFLITGTVNSREGGDTFIVALEKLAVKPFSIIVWVTVALYVALPLYRDALINFMNRSSKRMKEGCLSAKKNATKKCCRRKYLCCGEATSKAKREAEGREEEDDDGEEGDDLNEESVEAVKKKLARVGGRRR